ncbi:hypothetical protein AGMMS49574_27220 [Bacteroidia bacterium]|nr:hypothetical protein AGMMS49574_27220 [Bacteroidia bacterium]
MKIRKSESQKYHFVKKCPFFSLIFGADFAFEAKKRQDLRVNEIQKDNNSELIIDS